MKNLIPPLRPIMFSNKLFQLVTTYIDTSDKNKVRGSSNRCGRGG